MNLPPPFPAGLPDFVNDLRKPEIPRIRYQISDSPGFRLERSFPDPEGLLDTAFFQLERFWKTNGLEGEMPVIARQCCDLSGEAWRIAVTDGAIILESAEIEGMRRALYGLTEALTNRPLPESCEHVPWLRNRISRCFFGPIKRAPFFHDELTDDIDYYPEEYLQKLARDGVNGIWLTVVFREICRTQWFAEDPQAEQRRAKLRKTVERCRRYGIKVWAFAIEPIFWSPKNPPPPEHPEWVGPGSEQADWRTFCIQSPSAKEYLRQSTYSLFSEVPHLGGLMMISHGERPTSCLSSLYSLGENDRPCPNCDMPVGKILKEVLGAMRSGMQEAAPEAEVLSWLYQPWAEQHGEWVFHLPDHLDELDDKVILAYNCESGCSKRQAGKLRIGGDYWQSARPSDRFGRMAQAARGRCRFAAKLQVCCSHEMATVPFMPVPGMLYRKYKVLQDLGVTDVIQCWYFGNYPGMMNRAAGRLAFWDFKTGDETAFLTALAEPDWGEHAGQVVKAWQKFDKAYDAYPVNILMQYYGPMHDGVVWPLHLRRVRQCLPRTWKPDFEPAGDTIGECLADFTLPEAAVMAQKIDRLWQQGMAELADLAPECGPENELALYEAIGLHFSAAADIFEFYRLRAMLVDGRDVLAEMEEILQREIGITRRMLTLTALDSRLGYHSEAEVFKYFPAKLTWRLAELERVSAEDFPACRAAQDAAAWVLGQEETVCRPGIWYGDKRFRWRFMPGSRQFRLEAEAAVCSDGTEGASGEDCLEFRGAEYFLISFIDRLGVDVPWADLRVFPDGRVEGDKDAVVLETMEMVGDKRHMVLQIQSGVIPAGPGCCFAIQYANGGMIRRFPEAAFQPESPRLCFGAFTPEHLAYLEMDY